MYIGHPKEHVFPGSAIKDILVAAVGQAELVRGDWIKEGAVTWRFNHLEDHPRTRKWLVGPQFLGRVVGPRTQMAFNSMAYKMGVILTILTIPGMILQASGHPLLDLVQLTYYTVVSP